MDKKILTLRTCKNDFEKLANSEIKSRFLEVKKYWESRVLEKDWSPKVFDEILIKNWYSSDSPTIIAKFWWNKWIVEENWINYFEIWIWEILEISNY